MNSLYLILIVILFAVTSGIYQADVGKEKDRQLTTWITHLGCFMATAMEGDIRVMKHYLENNEPGICSRQCGDWPYFALKYNTCYCFINDVFNDMQETAINRCYHKCQDTDYAMYCGSKEKGFYTIYNRNQKLEVNGSSNCVARMKRKDTLQAVNCYEELYFICKTKADVRIRKVKMSFYNAKLFCENVGGRLTTFRERMPNECAFDTYYWTGTFRQLIVNVPDEYVSTKDEYSSATISTKAVTYEKGSEDNTCSCTTRNVTVFKTYYRQSCFNFSDWSVGNISFVVALVVIAVLGIIVMTLAKIICQLRKKLNAALFTNLTVKRGQYQYSAIPLLQHQPSTRSYMEVLPPIDHPQNGRSDKIKESTLCENIDTKDYIKSDESTGTGHYQYVL